MDPQILFFPPPPSATYVDPRPSHSQDDSCVGQQQNKSSVFAKRCALFRNIGAHKIHEGIKAFSSEAIRLANELPEGHNSQSLLECDIRHLFFK